MPVKLKVNHGHERRSCTDEVPGEPRVRGAPAHSRSRTACTIISTLYVYTVQCGVIMATIKVNVCRFCGSTVLPKHSVVLFSKEGLEKDLPGRVSRVVDLPVFREDGLSPYSSRPCMRKFQAAGKELLVDTFVPAEYTSGNVTLPKAVDLVDRQ